METPEIAEKLISYCKKADWTGAHNELYATDAKSIEPYETPEYPKEANGLEAIQVKTRQFEGSVEKIHKIKISKPLIAGNSIAFTMMMDLTIKGKGRMQSPELCVYEVKDGKIVSEQFFV